MSGGVLTCPSCGASPIPADDVELSLMIAKCSQCDTVFSFAETVGHDELEVFDRALGVPPTPSGAAPGIGSGVGSGVEHRAGRPLTPKKHRVQEAETPTGLSLEMRWFSAQHVALGFFALFWNGFLLVWYAIALSSFAAGDSEAAMGLCFPVIHVAVGIGVGYGALAGFVNRTLVEVRTGHISVTHGPLWWPGAVELDANDVEQLYVETRVIRGKNSSRTVYDLKARLRDGSSTDLCKGVSELSSARYLEHRVEGWLGIEDQPVAGEHLGS